MRRLTCLLVLALVVSMVGCGAQSTPEQIQQTCDTLKAMAQSGNVRGTARITIDGRGKAGMFNGITWGFGGTRLDADLSFRFSPTTRPVLGAN